MHRRLPVFLLACLAGAAHASPIPALEPDPSAPAGACGMVTTSARVPEGIDLHPARVLRAGEHRLRARNLHRLQPGVHVLVVAEAIAEKDLSTVQVRQRTQLRHRNVDIYKPLIVEVRPDRLYRVGVHLMRDQLDRASIRRNAYWVPVVYEEMQQSCS